MQYIYLKKTQKKIEIFFSLILRTFRKKSYMIKINDTYQ
jgi:hypothetical protein